MAMKKPWLLMAYCSHPYPLKGRDLVGVTVLEDGPLFYQLSDNFGAFLKADHMEASKIK